MRFTPLINNDDLAGIEITHANDSIRFTLAKNNGKRNFTQLPIIFNSVNSLISTLNNDEQEELFSIYVNIHDLTIHKVDGVGFPELVEDLTGLIDGIFNLLPLDGIRLWSVNSYSDFKVPETITTTVVGGNYPVATSYNVPEYLELCGLSTIFKLLIPITFGFMRDFRDVFGTEFKEFNMMFLFNSLELDTFAPFKKLLDQAECILEVRGEIKVPMGLLEHGIGPEHYPLFSISGDVIRTLCLSETDVTYRNNGKPNNITAKLTMAIKKSCESNKVAFGYEDKKLPKDRDVSGDGGNTTIQEDERSVQKYSDLYGRYLNKEFGRDDFHRRYGITDDVHAIFRASVLNNEPTIDEGKMLIMGMCFPTYANVESFTLLPLVTMQKVLTNAAAYLHQLGLYSLVNYLLAKEDKDPDSGISGSKYRASGTKPNKDILAKAKELYEVNSDDRTGLELGLNDLVNIICKPNWIKMSPQELHSSYAVNEEWIADINLKDHIMMLILATYPQQ